MKKIKITMRDVFFFLLGIIAIVIIDAIISWPDARDSFMEGWRDGMRHNTIENTR